MKIVNPILGDISGSLGGITFRVQNGQTVASQKKPSKPILKLHPMFTSIIQLETVNIWKEVDTVKKNGWEIFAGTIFKPRHHTNVGTASGYNAFFSLIATAKKMDMIKIPCELKSDGVVISDPTSTTKFQYSTTAPLMAGTGTIKTTAETDDIILNLSKVERTEENVIFTLSIVNSEIESYELKQPLQDTNANPVGFVIYATTPKNSRSAKNNKKFNSIVLATRPSLATTAPTVTNTVELSVSIEDLKKSVMAEYNLKSFVDLSFCVCTGEGVVTFVNKHTIQVRDIYEEPQAPTGDPTIIFGAYSAPFTNVYNTRTKAFTEIDFGVSAKVVACAISEKYIVIGNQTAQTSGSSIQIYNRETEAFINLEITITSNIIKVFIDGDTLYIRTNFVGQVYSYFARFNLLTGNCMYGPSIDKSQVESVVFSENTIFLSGAVNMYLSRPFMMIDKVTGNVVTTVFPENKRIQQVLIDETRKYVILIDYSFTLSNVKIYNYETGDLLHTTTIPKYFWGGVVKDNKVWLMSMYLSPNTEENNFKIDLDTFEIEPFGQPMINYTTIPFLSANNLFAGNTYASTGISGLAIFDETENLWSYSTDFISQKAESIAGIP